MRVRLVQGDITTLDVDAVVNAANSGLLGGGGVDGAIHRAAGPELLEECRRLRSTTHIGGLPAGLAIMTNGYRLRARHVIHTVGPVYSPGRDQSAVLASAFRSSLVLADAHGLKTIAFPAISTGVYGYPKEECAVIARSVFEAFVPRFLVETIMCLYGESDFLTFRRIFEGR
ncbi:MAG: O-acetyl-ADP-ribose deacetylase [Chloroflexi bacterium]|nr:O-acetyl-ADP-ribose deacetylase [Chloroflexota bacterium]